VFDFTNIACFLIGAMRVLLHERCVFAYRCDVYCYISSACLLTGLMPVLLHDRCVFAYRTDACFVT